MEAHRWRVEGPPEASLAPLRRGPPSPGDASPPDAREVGRRLLEARASIRGSRAKAKADAELTGIHGQRRRAQHAIADLLDLSFLEDDDTDGRPVQLALPFTGSAERGDTGGLPPVFSCVHGHNCNRDPWTCVQSGTPVSCVRAGVVHAVGAILIACGDDTLRPSDVAVAKAYGPESFMGEVEDLTVGFRRRRERSLRARAIASKYAAVRQPAGATIERVRKGKKVQVPAQEALKVTAKWYASRATGQARRFETTRKCGIGVVHVRCQGVKSSGERCDHELGLPASCAVRRLCVQCRERLAGPRRERLERAMAAARRDAQDLGLLRHDRRGGRWSEKHLTLTIPHGPVAGAGAVRARCDMIFFAWRRFSMRMGKWLRGKVKHGPAAPDGPVWWFRGFEWTGGSPDEDGVSRGHPHFHVWIFAPFLPAPLLRLWWALALYEAGLTGIFASPDDPSGRATMRRASRTHLLPEHVEIRIGIAEVKLRRKGFGLELVKGARSLSAEGTKASPRAAATRAKRAALKFDVVGGEDLARYIEGWVVSEKDSNGNFVSPETWAELYEATEGRRQAQAARGFIRMGDRLSSCPCCQLVATGTNLYRVNIVPWYSGRVAEVRASLGLVRAGPQLRKADQRDTWRQLRLVV